MTDGLPDDGVAALFSLLLRFKGNNMVRQQADPAGRLGGRRSCVACNRSVHEHPTDR